MERIIIREVQTLCPQCGREYAYFEYEEGDFTGGTPFIIIEHTCPYCGYPYTIWDDHKWMFTGTGIYYPQVKVSYSCSSWDKIEDLSLSVTI